MRLAPARSAIAGVTVILVVSIIVVAVGAGSFVALDQSKTNGTTFLSTVVPVTSTSLTPISSSSSSNSSSSISVSPKNFTSTTTVGTTNFSTSNVTSSSNTTSSSANSTSSQLVEASTSSTSTAFSTIFASSTDCTYSTSISNESGLLNIFSSLFPSYEIKDLFGNFSQMSLQFSSNSYTNDSLFGNGTSFANTSELISESYSVVGTQLINGTDYTLVNFSADVSTNAGSLGSSTENETGTFYFNPSWNATLIVFSGETISGQIASTMASVLLIFFELPFLYTTFVTSMTSGAQLMSEINQTSANFGNVSMDVTNYNITSSAANSTTSSASIMSSGCGEVSDSSQTNSTVSGILQLGKLPVTGTTLLTMLDFSTSTPSVGTTSGIFQIVSLTLAPGYDSVSSTTSTSATTKTTSTMTTI